MNQHVLITRFKLKLT